MRSGIRSLAMWSGSRRLSGGWYTLFLKLFMSPRYMPVMSNFLADGDTPNPMFSSTTDALRANSWICENAWAIVALVVNVLSNL